MKIALSLAALVGVSLIVGCSSDPGPNEPHTFVAGQRPSPGGGDNDEQVARDPPDPNGTHGLTFAPSVSPVPNPWNPPGDAPGPDVLHAPSSNGPQPDQAQQPSSTTTTTSKH